MRSRRHILAGMGAAVAAAGLPSLARAIPAESGGRTLAFDNLHTGERATIEYWSNGIYVPDALQQVNFILRDFRNGEIHSIDPRLLDLLSHLHGTLDSAAPFEVISGYRSPATNAMLREASHGVASKSLHMQGQAIDIRLSDRSLADLHTAAVGLRLGGVGYYPGPDFVHVDVGRVRYW
ncbi:MAG TPA: DUF882 domain-containing protein [Candidatus Acidoferrum sp.]|nr:DUF882 domain-containing protein [Candidatus Acidoferrum sp.]